MFKFCFPTFLLLFGCHHSKHHRHEDIRTREQTLDENRKITEDHLINPGFPQARDWGFPVLKSHANFPGDGHFIEADIKPAEIFVG